MDMQSKINPNELKLKQRTFSKRSRLLWAIYLFISSTLLYGANQGNILSASSHTQSTKNDTLLNKCISESITLAWADQADNENGFCIEVKRGLQGKWVALDSVRMNLSQYGPFTMDTPDIYGFRVYAYNYFGNSNYTNAVYVNLTCPEIAAPDIKTVERLGNNQVMLSWEAVNNVKGYNIYRSTDADFTPDMTNGSNRIATHVTDMDNKSTGIQWMDKNAGAQDPDINYFYIITAVSNFEDESQASACIGEFDFVLKATTTTSFNQIAVPFQVNGIEDAEDLMGVIPYCDAVARWDAASQSYVQFLPNISQTNFSVYAGQTYYVNVKKDTIFSFFGKTNTPSYNLKTTTTTNFNELMLPFQKKNIKNASELMSDIPSCNSIAYWDADMQGYVQYIPGIEITNFQVKSGHPYFVNVEEEITWPQTSSVAKTTAAEHAESSAGSKGFSNAPHLVWGQYDLEDTTMIASFQFEAWITRKTGDKLTSQSAGCAFENGYWMVQCASFGSAWSAGDTLIVSFKQNNEVLIQTQIVLTFGPDDEADMIDLDCISGIDHLTDSRPESFNLAQNYPNPFNPETIIPYELPENSDVTITIYNLLGQKVRTLVNQPTEAGYHQIAWDGFNDQGQQVSSNVYLVCMQSASFTETMKITLLR